MRHDPAGFVHHEAERREHLAPRSAGPGWGALHPFAPVESDRGYQEVFRQLSDALAKCTGFTAVSLQPNSGAQGEYASCS